MRSLIVLGTAALLLAGCAQTRDVASAECQAGHAAIGENPATCAGGVAHLQTGPGSPNWKSSRGGPG